MSLFSQAEEKAERYLRRQQRRAELESKRKERDDSESLGRQPKTEVAKEKTTVKSKGVK